MKHKVHGSDPGCGLTCAGLICTVSIKAGGHHMQILPRDNSALDLHANAMSVAQCKGCRGTCNQICHWKEKMEAKTP